MAPAINPHLKSAPDEALRIVGGFKMDLVLNVLSGWDGIVKEEWYLYKEGDQIANHFDEYHSKHASPTFAAYRTLLNGLRYIYNHHRPLTSLHIILRDQTAYNQIWGRYRVNKNHLMELLERIYMGFEYLNCTVTMELHTKPKTGSSIRGGADSFYSGKRNRSL